MSQFTTSFAPSAPSNETMYSTTFNLILHNWVPKMTETMVSDLFERNQVGRVSKLVVAPDEKTATVVVDEWFKTANGNDALYHLTFSNLLDVRVDGYNSNHNRNLFLLFTTEPQQQKQMQMLSGPPGLCRAV